MLWISADKKKLKLPDKGSVTFDLAKAPEGLVVNIDLWEKKPRFRRYCNDIADDTKREATWKANKGKLTLTIFEPADKKDVGPPNYKVSAKLEGVVFDEAAIRQLRALYDSLPPDRQRRLYSFAHDDPQLRDYIPPPLPQQPPQPGAP